MRLSPTRLEVHPTAAKRLEDQLHGEIVRPGSRAYREQRRVWNGAIDRHPALIVRCADRTDVSSAIHFARETGLPAAVRSGGHSFPGHSVVEGGIVIDLGLMSGIRVDRRRRTVRAQAGLRLGDLDRATQPHGLAVPTGIVSHTGLAGLTLGGGIGWLMRSHGLTIDQLLSVDLVTAEGEMVHASSTKNPELFWGVRGGGGNFGVATQFEFALNPIPQQVIAGGMTWPLSAAPQLLRFYREWIAEAPDELATIVTFRKAQPLPWMPKELHGQPVVNIVCCYNGGLECGRAEIDKLRSFRRPAVDRCGPRTFLAHQSAFDASFTPGWCYYSRSCDVAELSDAVIDIAVDFAARISSPKTTFPIWQLGGAMSRLPEAATAFSGRGAGHTFNITGMTESIAGFAEERMWVRDFWNALAPYHQSVYVNFLMDEGEERVRQAYGAEKYEQLRKLKRRYDPDDFFRLNQNIAP